MSYVSARRLAALSCVALLATTAACSSKPSSTASASAADNAITLYSSMGYGQQTGDAFTKKTGIKVNVVEDSGAALMTKVGAEKNNPQWTLLWSEGDQAFNTLDQQGQLKKPLALNSAYNEIGKSIIPADNAYVPSSVTVMAGVECNMAKISKLPTSWQELTDPMYGKIAMGDPSQGGTTYPFISGIMEQMGGIDQGKAWFTTLKKNGLQILNGSNDQRHALETGQIDCVIMQSSGAEGEIIKNPPKDGWNPQVTFMSKQTLLPGVLAISSKAPAAAQANAQKFIDFMNSPEGYDVSKAAAPTGASLNWPVIDGASAPSQLPAMPAYQHLDPAVWGPRQQDIVNWFVNNIKG